MVYFPVCLKNFFLMSIGLCMTVISWIFSWVAYTCAIYQSSTTETQTDHGETELSNMLVKKNGLDKINKEETFTQGFKDCRKIKRKVSQNLDDLQNLLIKLTVKASSEKAWLLYEFPFSLNPGDKPNDAQA